MDTQAVQAMQAHAVQAMKAAQALREQAVQAYVARARNAKAAQAMPQDVQAHAAQALREQAAQAMQAMRAAQAAQAQAAQALREQVLQASVDYWTNYNVRVHLAQVQVQHCKACSQAAQAQAAHLQAQVLLAVQAAHPTLDCTDIDAMRLWIAAQANEQAVQALQARALQAAQVVDAAQAAHAHKVQALQALLAPYTDTSEPCEPAPSRAPASKAFASVVDGCKRTARTDTSKPDYSARACYYDTLTQGSHHGRTRNCGALAIALACRWPAHKQDKRTACAATVWTTSDKQVQGFWHYSLAPVYHYTRTDTPDKAQDKVRVHTRLRYVMTQAALAARRASASKASAKAAQARQAKARATLQALQAQAVITPDKGLVDY